MCIPQCAWGCGCQRITCKSMLPPLSLSLFLGGVLRLGFSIKPWLSWNSLCRSGWPQTQKSTASTSRVLGLKACATTPGLRILILKHFLCLYSSCPFHCCNKRNQKQLEENVSASNPWSHCIPEGSQSRKLGARTEAKAVEEYCSLACSSQLGQFAFLYNPGPGFALPIVSWT